MVLFKILMKKHVKLNKICYKKNRRIQFKMKKMKLLYIEKNNIMNVKCSSLKKNKMIVCNKNKKLKIWILKEIRKNKIIRQNNKKIK